MGADGNGAVRKQLWGVWAALPVPWKDGSSVDGDLVVEIVRRYSEAGLNGWYTSGTDGEMHALEPDMFIKLAEAASAAKDQVALPSQLGVSWVNERGIITRARIARELGFGAVQTALPFWEPVGRADAVAFFGRLAESVPELAIIHYNIARVGRIVSGAEYGQIVAAAPSLIGSKLTGGDADLVIDCVRHAPSMAHFVVDGHMMPGALLGAVGIYSAVANLSPRWAAEWWAAVRDGEWDEVARRRSMLVLFRERWREILGDIASPAVAKAFARCGVAPEISLAIQPPYRAATEAQVDSLAKVLKADFPELRYVP